MEKSQVNELDQQFETYKENITKFYDGNKAAGLKETTCLVQFETSNSPCS